MNYRYHLSRTQLRQRAVSRRDYRGGIGSAGTAHRANGPKRGQAASRPFRGLLISLAATSLLTGVVWGVDAFLRTERFVLREIRVSGLDRIAESEILGRIRPPSDTRLFDLDIAAIQEVLLADPWIREVTLRKEYPDMLSVFIVERHPAAVLVNPPFSALADEAGAIMARWAIGDAEAESWSSLPVIRGVDISGIARRENGALERFAAARTALREAGPREGEGLVVDVTRPSDIQVLRDGRRFHVGAAPFEAKWRRFRSVQAEIAPNSPPSGGAVVDLRFPNQVIIR